MCDNTNLRAITAPASAVGVRSTYQEGSGNGLNGSGSNGFCWNGGDDAGNPFMGHAGWNQSGYDCYDTGHLSYIGVFDISGDATPQYTSVDIDTTSWMNTGEDTTQVGVSFYAR